MLKVYHHIVQLSLFPEKQCTGKCKQFYPATLDYFLPSETSDDGLRGCCKECRKEIKRRSATKKRAEKRAKEGPKPGKRARMVSLTCAQCGKEFQRKAEKYNYSRKISKTGQFFCSPRCSGASNGSPIEDEYLDNATMKRCPTCPEPEENKWHPATPEYFYRCNANKDKLNNYCKKCQDEQTRKARGHGRKATAWITLTCASCGEDFQRTASQHRTLQHDNKSGKYYCSKTCAADAIRFTLPPSIKDEYIAGATGEEIAEKYHVSTSVVYRVLNEVHTPMRPKEGGRWTQERRDQAALRCIERVNKGERIVSSKLEDTVALELSRQGYAFCRQAPIRDPQTGRYIALADFQLLDGCVIEVNGTYWHADPRKYPNGPIHKRQIRGIESYKRKVQALTEMSIPLIELWEYDLRKDMPGTIERALATHVPPPSECAVS